MKNKRLMGILLGFGLLVAGLIAYQTLGSKSTQTETSQAKVGVLQYVTHESLDTIYQGIVAGLAEAGYEGDKIAIDFMNAEGDQSKVQTMSQSLVNNGNQVLIGIATPAAQGLASATKDLPIIMGAITDPVGANLVTNLDNPGGNISGVSDATPIQAQIDLIKTLTPDVKTIGVLYANSEDNSVSQVNSFKELAQKAGYTVVEYAVPSTNEIKTTMEVLAGKVDALWVPVDNTLASAFSTVAQVAKEQKLPVYPSSDGMVAEGGLASVVLDQYQLGVATGKMAAQVLAGKSVGSLPVQVFDQGSPIINKTVAAELGISIPEEVLAQAGTVIE